MSCWRTISRSDTCDDIQPHLATVLSDASALIALNRIALYVALRAALDAECCFISCWLACAAVVARYGGRCVHQLPAGPRDMRSARCWSNIDAKASPPRPPSNSLDLNGLLRICFSIVP